MALGRVSILTMKQPMLEGQSIGMDGIWYRRIQRMDTSRCCTMVTTTNDGLEHKLA
jgi:hypothetical protein